MNFSPLPWFLFSLLASRFHSIPYILYLYVREYAKWGWLLEENWHKTLDTMCLHMQWGAWHNFHINNSPWFSMWKIQISLSSSATATPTATMLIWHNPLEKGHTTIYAPFYWMHWIDDKLCEEIMLGLSHKPRIAYELLASSSLDPPNFSCTLHPECMSMEKMKQWLYALSVA